MTQPPHPPQPSDRPFGAPQQPWQGPPAQQGFPGQGVPGQGVPQHGQGRPLPPPGFLKLHLQGNQLLAMITPTVKVDGRVVPATYGENVIPVVPGQHRVDVHAQWMWTYGQADSPFAVREGETAELWYAAPFITFIKGNIGPHKQKIPGLVPFLLVMALIVLVPVLLIVVAALAGS